MSAYRILIIDDEPMQLKALAGFLRNKGFGVEETTLAIEGIQLMRRHPIDLVLTDFKMPGKNGMEVLMEAKAINPEIDVVLMTAFGSIESAKEALKRGAIDYLTKPIDLLQLEHMIKKNLERKQLISENRRLKEQLAEKTRFKNIISHSREMEEVLSRAARVAVSKATVLIRGESGTGKEQIALAIHAASPRKDGSFVAVNCAALSETLLETELFGHEKGAFTGAVQQVKGRFERAHGGTLFIDEVGDIPTGVQVKLLRAIQEQAFERVGGTEIIQVDTRIIAATNRDLENLVKTGKFREDLYYRLNVVSVIVPPLRERRSDIAPLINHFLQKFSDENQKKMKRASKEALDLLMKYDYPGNVRELENIIEQAVVLSRGELITSDDLPLTVQEKQSEQELSTGDLEERVAAYEQKLIQQALDKTGGVQTKAAELLGLSERNLRYKLKKHGMK
ncbi:MAG: sigma-54 dependent transcriptional regulator [Calditrichia bacterium]|nr:sigma-54-dependent Fis family transcriptional regulator [Calditrichota bacterium]MCB0266661.1 sigma-54-dependent Fis family transcriptional regulator [Calditrichota bacterium]MCB9067233.1 sigma-54-dependent Fis family transcriptional regulator [Calditrichia bacterium]